MTILVRFYGISFFVKIEFEIMKGVERQKTK